MWRSLDIGRSSRIAEETLRLETLVGGRLDALPLAWRFGCRSVRAPAAGASGAARGYRSFAGLRVCRGREERRVALLVR
eukprot:9473298-Pyramimonas_sp.AAC.1